MRPGFTIVAIIAARDEGDIIGQVIDDLVTQGVDVYLLDDGSTDGTAAIAEQYRGRGVIGIERIGEPGDKFQWSRILRRKSRLAHELDADWFIHHDADEFRESPWDGLSLKAAIQRVDGLGYNAIDSVCLNFWPVHDNFHPGDDVRAAFTFFEAPAPYDRIQVRCWKKQSEEVDLLPAGGHDAMFPDRRVFPIRFILRHYPLRGQRHGERKIADRRARVLREEHDRGWHIQYDEIASGAALVRDPNALIRYDAEAFRLALRVCADVAGGCDADPRLRDVRSARSDAEMARAELTSARGEIAAARAALDSERDKLQTVAAEYAMLEAKHRALETEHHAFIAELSLQQRRAEQHAQALSMDLQIHARELERLRAEVAALRGSMSWQITAPLRTVYERVAHVPAGGESDRQDPQLVPVSQSWGLDRGQPVDRHYIERFLQQHRGDIRGHVLEVKDDGYTRLLGGAAVTACDVLDIDGSNPRATIVGDLARFDSVASHQFDCFILTQTLHIIYDIRAALGHAWRVVKHGGVLLCTIPSVSRVNNENGGLESGDYWRVTAAAVRRLFAELPETADVSVESFGNVRVCSAFLYGFAAADLTQEELAFNDPWFPLIHCVRALKRIPDRVTA